MFPFNFCFVNYSVVYKSKGETKDTELEEEEQARIGADPSSGTSNKYENYKKEARKKTQKHKPKRVESVNADAEAFGDDWKIMIALCIVKLKQWTIRIKEIQAIKMCHWTIRQEIDIC
ncbi:hypothetical protein AAZX31_04G102700 [Glycine max]